MVEVGSVGASVRRCVADVGQILGSLEWVEWVDKILV